MKRASVIGASPMRGLTSVPTAHLRQAEQAFLLEVVAHEVRLVVEDELVGELRGPLVGHLRVRRLGVAHAEDRAVHRVHREEGRGHAGAGCEELAPADMPWRFACTSSPISLIRPSTLR